MLDKRELDARVAIHLWAEAEEKKHQAEGRLSSARYERFLGDHQALDLIENYKKVCDAADKAKAAMLAGRPSTTNEQYNKVRQQVHADFIDAPRVARDRTVTEASIRQEQQDFEIERNRRESLMAEQSVKGERGPSGPAYPAAPQALLPELPDYLQDDSVDEDDSRTEAPPHTPEGAPIPNNQRGDLKHDMDPQGHGTPAVGEGTSGSDQERTPVGNKNAPKSASQPASKAEPKPRGRAGEEQ